MKKGRAADLGLARGPDRTHLLERGDVGEEVLYVLPTEVQVRHRWMRIGDKGGEKVRISGQSARDRGECRHVGICMGLARRNQVAS
jgi:hypothetical protein